MSIHEEIWILNIAGNRRREQYIDIISEGMSDVWVIYSITKREESVEVKFYELVLNYILLGLAPTFKHTIQSFVQALRSQ